MWLAGFYHHLESLALLGFPPILLIQRRFLRIFQFYLLNIFSHVHIQWLQFFHQIVCELRCKIDKLPGYTFLFRIPTSSLTAKDATNWIYWASLCAAELQWISVYPLDRQNGYFRVCTCAVPTQTIVSRQHWIWDDMSYFIPYFEHDLVFLDHSTIPLLCEHLLILLFGFVSNRGCILQVQVLCLYPGQGWELNQLERHKLLVW